MNEQIGNNNDEFIKRTRMRVQEKVTEYYKLLHDRERISVMLERTKNYINQLNNFLVAEGEKPIQLKEFPQGSGFGKPGNRSPDFPVRRTEWTGMTLDEIIKTILGANPNDVYHADLLAHKIYEIKDDNDLKKVKRSLVSILRKGASKKGLWESLKGNKYKAKATQQERLIKV